MIKQNSNDKYKKKANKANTKTQKHSDTQKHNESTDKNNTRIKTATQQKLKAKNNNAKNKTYKPHQSKPKS